MKKKLMLFALCLLVPACALAVEEGVVEEAPQVQMQIDAVQEVSYLPDAAYYFGEDYSPSWEEAETWVADEHYDGEMYYEVLQAPRLTAGEARRAEALLEDYQAGKIAYTGESVLGKMENVVVGVYALDPADYDGETVFTLLPGPCMTDEQLLAVIAAYDELGLTFDPDKLNYRNCARGGGIETTRFMTDEERERYTMMAEKVRRGIIATDEKYAGLLRNPTLDSAYFCGMRDFTLSPYRSMTDEELLSLLMSIGVYDESGETDFDGIERRAREVLGGLLGAPLSMKQNGIKDGGSYVPNLFTPECEKGWDWQTPGRGMYSASFEYTRQDGIFVYVNASFDSETDELVHASTMHSREWDFPPEGESVTQENIAAATVQAEALIGKSGFEWHAMTDELTATNWGMCLPVRAQIDARYWMTIFIGMDDGLTHGYQIELGTPVEELPEDPSQNDG